jgi:hypothetical protein
MAQEQAAKSGGARSGRNQPVASRKAKTTKLFKSPSGFPNGVAVTPEGLWIPEQELSGAIAAQYHLPEPKDLSEKAWLVDWNGKVLKEVSTPSRNTSGMAVGGLVHPNSRKMNRSEPRVSRQLGIGRLTSAWSVRTNPLARWTQFRTYVRA